jgi:predicted ATP-grasp superfamily ATP-dependent carboligase
VIGGGAGNGVSIARNLGEQGIPVYCLTSNPQDVTRYSKYCRGAAIVPEVERDPARLQRVLHQWAPRLAQPCVLFPTTDTAVLTLATIQHQLAPYVTYIPHHSVVETMVVKSRFYHSLRLHQIPHPRTFNPQDTPLDDMTQRLSFPVYIRPAQTLLFGAHFPGKGFVAHNVRELQRYVQLTRRLGLEVMVQEIIPGPTTHGYGISGCIDHHGHLVAFYAVQKLRQPSMILNYLRQMRYRGVFGAEMKWDARDQSMKFLEVNARSMGGNYLGVACGSNHVLAAYQDALGIPVEPALHYEPGIHYLELLYDLVTMGLLAWRHHEWQPGLRPYTQRYLGNYVRRGDNRPFLKHVVTFLRDTLAQIS